MAETQLKKEAKDKEEKKEWNLSREKILAIKKEKETNETNGLAFITQSITGKVESRFI